MEPNKKKQKLLTPLELFLIGQYHEDDNEQHAYDLYFKIYTHHHPTLPYTYTTKTNQQPNKSLIHSCACNSLGGFETERNNISQARIYFQAALKSWSNNAMALINLANMEREHGDPSVALRLYTQCKNLPLLTYQTTTTDEEEDPYDWEEAWIIGPRTQCIAKATYLYCLMLHQRNQGPATLQDLSKFGITWKISDQVWNTAMQPRPNENTLTTKINTKNIKSTTSISPPSLPVRYVPSVIPTHDSNRMRDIFRSSSPFWIETNYVERGYFSFWYDFSKKPQNFIEYMIHRYIYTSSNCETTAKTTDTPIVGAEWWVHSRALGRNLGHQLHFDTEEHSLEDKHEILHPTISSVLYLTQNEDAGGGPTVIFDQTSIDTEPADVAVVCHPVTDAVLYFNGNRLHGVLPTVGNEKKDRKEEMEDMEVGNGPNSKTKSNALNDTGVTTTTGFTGSRLDSSSSTDMDANTANTAPASAVDAEVDVVVVDEKRRLTFMVGFWNVDVTKIGKERVPYGPCGPMPDAEEEGCTWHHEMKMTTKEEIECNEWWNQKTKKEKEEKGNGKKEDHLNMEVKEVEELLGVSVISPAWEKVPSPSPPPSYSSINSDSSIPASVASSVAGSTSSKDIHFDGDNNFDSCELEMPDDIDQRFFVQHMEDFRAHLLQRALSKPTMESSEEDEEEDEWDEMNERPWH